MADSETHPPLAGDPFVSGAESDAAEVPMPSAGPRVLGFGAHSHVARAVQDRLRLAGLRATAFAVADDADSDERLRAALLADDYDAVALGAFITAQHPDVRPTEQTTVWFNRVLNLVHQTAPRARLVLVRGPEQAVDDIRRVLAG